MLALLLSVALAPSAPVPAGAVDLRWKFKTGDQFYMTTVQDMKQSMDVPGVGKQEFSMKQTMVVKMVVKSASEKETVLEQTFLSTKMSMTPETPGADKMADLLTGSTLVLHLNDKNEVSKMQGLDAMVEKITADNPALKTMFKTMFTEDTFKQMTSKWFNGPGKPVTPGDTWKQEQKMPMGPLGNLVITLNNKYVGVKDDLDQTTFTGDLVWKAADAGDAPLKLTKADFKAEKLEGEMIFDRKLGRARSSTMIMKATGTMTIAAAGQEIAMGMTQESTTKMTISDKEPKKE